MAETDKQKTAPTAEAAGSTGQYQAVARDRRVDRTGDLRRRRSRRRPVSEISTPSSSRPGRL